MRPPESRHRRVDIRYDDPSYWSVLSHQRYYKRTVKLAKRAAPWARSVLDVGSSNTEYIRRLDWIPHRVRIDVLPLRPLEGVTDTQADFMTYRPDRTYDLVLCLQVIEHVEDPTGFCRRLLAAGKIVIISVPYRWPAGAKDDHPHDPVDPAKLQSWTGRKPLGQEIVREFEGPMGGRLLTLYMGDRCPLHRAIRLRLKARRRFGSLDEGEASPG